MSWPKSTWSRPTGGRPVVPEFVVEDEVRGFRFVPDGLRQAKVNAWLWSERTYMTRSEHRGHSDRSHWRNTRYG